MSEHRKPRTWEPRDDRRPVNLRAFALSSLRDADVVVTDLSYDGCRISSSEDFKPGEHVELRVLKLGSVQSEIRWASDGRAGARFLK